MTDVMLTCISSTGNLVLHGIHACIKGIPIMLHVLLTCNTHVYTQSWVDQGQCLWNAVVDKNPFYYIYVHTMYNNI